MAQVRHVQHGSQPLIPLRSAEVVLADHGGIEQREEPRELIVGSIFGCQDEFARLPSKQVVLQAQEAIDPPCVDAHAFPVEASMTERPSASEPRTTAARRDCSSPSRSPSS